MLAVLRRRIAAIEGDVAYFDAPAAGEEAWTPGLDGLDAALPRGLSAAGLHEVAGAGPRDGPAAAAFAAALLRRRLIAGPPGTIVLWSGTRRAASEHGALYGPGLQAFGLLPDRFLFVRGRKDKDVLWAMEEGLRSRAVAAVVGEVATASFTATRRLDLASQTHKVPSLLLRLPGRSGPSAARTCWRVSPAPSAPPSFDAKAPGLARWRLDLARCRGGRPRTWMVEWDHETGCFRLAAALADRPLAAAASRRRAG